jgi:hypothetical protein
MRKQVKTLEDKHMKKFIRERLDDPEVQMILDDIRVSVVGIVGSLVVVGAINGIYALCECLKNLAI